MKKFSLCAVLLCAAMIGCNGGGKSGTAASVSTSGTNSAKVGGTSAGSAPPPATAPAGS